MQQKIKFVNHKSWRMYAKSRMNIIQSSQNADYVWSTMCMLLYTLNSLRIIQWWTNFHIYRCAHRQITEKHQQLQQQQLLYEWMWRKDEKLDSKKNRKSKNWARVKRNRMCTELDTFSVLAFGNYSFMNIELLLNYYYYMMIVDILARPTH